MKFDSILVFGDSHTAGWEVSPDSDKIYKQYFDKKIPLEHQDEYTKEYVFSSVLGKMCNVPVYNFSVCSGSNDRSLRLLPRKLMEYPNSLVIFGYTSPDRTEFYYPEPDWYQFRDKDLYAQVKIEYPDFNNKITQSTLNSLYTKEFLFVDNKDDTKIVNQIFYVDNVCKKYAYNVIHVLISEQLLTGKNKDIFNEVSSNIFPFNSTQDNLGYGSYFTHYLSKKFSLGKWKHFGKDAHQDFAEILFKYIHLNMNSELKNERTN
jgi:hypothetical protein